MSYYLPVLAIISIACLTLFTCEAPNHPFGSSYLEFPQSQRIGGREPLAASVMDLGLLKFYTIAHSNAYLIRGKNLVME